MEVIAQMNDISVEFPGVKALDGVDFSLLKGEIHVLLGENGAGKSTLVKILSGVYKQDNGSIFIEDNIVDFNNIKEAMDAGINIVHQELNLVLGLTIAENIFLGREPKKHGRINKKKMNIDTESLLQSIGIEEYLSAKDLVANLSASQRQLVEIAKNISKQSKIIILDEPTSSLTGKEVDVLFNTLLDLKKNGVSIIYITHKFDEIKKIGDRATILRDGSMVKTVNIAETPVDEMIKMMVGRNLEEIYPKTSCNIGDVIFEINNISNENIKNCSLNVREGEIVGISGLVGSGRTELARAIIGADQITEGSKKYKDKLVRLNTPEQSVSTGIGYLPEDRKHEGLILGMDVRENITLASLKKTLSNYVISRKKEDSFANEYSSLLKIKTPSLNQRVKYLSGGNQQKIVLAKWLMSECNVLIFDEPTRGIDVGAKTEIYKLISEMASQGIGIIMISSELPEILGMSDRIYVMCNGSIVKELSKNEATQVNIMNYATKINDDYLSIEC